MDSNRLGENLMEYIKSEVDKVEYGRIVIELNKGSDKVDVITEKRHRFEKKGKDKVAGKLRYPKEYNKG